MATSAERQREPDHAAAFRADRMRYTLATPMPVWRAISSRVAPLSASLCTSQTWRAR